MKFEDLLLSAMQSLELEPVLQNPEDPPPVNPFEGSLYTENGRPSIMHE